MFRENSARGTPNGGLILNKQKDIRLTTRLSRQIF